MTLVFLIFGALWVAIGLVLGIRYVSEEKPDLGRLDLVLFLAMSALLGLPALVVATVTIAAVVVYGIFTSTSSTKKGDD